MSFYDDIAADYDAMTGSPQRTQRVNELTQTLIERYQPRCVLDVACGSGLQAIALAQAGLNVTAADASASMLAQATQAARKANVSIQCVHAPMQTAHEAITGPYDLILCLGNSLPHLLTDNDLAATCNRFVSLLRPGGVALIHLLNYPRILSQDERIVAVSRSGDTEFIRFYDFLESTVRFNLLRITWKSQQQSPQHSLTSTELRPYAPDQVAAALRQAQFQPIHYYADTSFSPLDRATSQSVIIEATRCPNPS